MEVAPTRWSLCARVECLEASHCYRLVESPAEASNWLTRLMEKGHFPSPLHLESVESTNTWMLREADSLPEWSVVYTFDQSQGRGRRGRVWSSLPGDTLAMSILLPALPEEVPVTWVPLLAGSSLVRVLRNLGLAAAQVKWPNDVLVGPRKLSGTLVEQTVRGSLIVGIGINVFSAADRLPDPDATSLVIECVAIVDPLESLVGPVRDTLHHMIQEGLSRECEGHLAFWSDHVGQTLGTIGGRIQSVGDDGLERQGTAEGLGPRGELRVRADDGDDFTVHAGDVFHIPRS